MHVGRKFTIEVDGRIGTETIIANGVGITRRRDHDAREVGSSIQKSRWVGIHPLKMSDPVIVEGGSWIGFCQGQVLHVLPTAHG